MNPQNPTAWPAGWLPSYLFLTGPLRNPDFTRHLKQDIAFQKSRTYFMSYFWTMSYFHALLHALLSMPYFHALLSGVGREVGHGRT